MSSVDAVVAKLTAKVARMSWSENETGSGFNAEVNGHVYIIGEDTATGRVWLRVLDAEGTEVIGTGAEIDDQSLGGLYTAIKARASADRSEVYTGLIADLNEVQ